MNNHNNHQQLGERKNSELIDMRQDEVIEDQKWSTERYVNSILDQVITISARLAQKNKKVMAMLEVFSKEKTMGNINQVNDLFFYSMNMPAFTKAQEAEPQPLRVDSLLPISADIDHHKKTMKNISFGGLSEIGSRATGTARNSPTPKETYLKLDLPPPEQEDGYTKQLRRLQDQRQNKKDVQRKQEQKKERIRQQRMKEKKNQKQQNFSYGYNGEVIEIKLQNKANLVSKIINGQTNNGTKIIKQVSSDMNPTLLEGYKPGKKDKKIFIINAAPKKNEVQFSEINSLAENIKTTNGIKYTYQGKTYQQKRKVVTANELKKTLSERRISKEQFGKIRNLYGNRYQQKQILKKSNVKDNENPQQLRAKSYSRMSQSRNLKKKEVIHVSSKNLRQRLLERELKPLVDPKDEQQDDSPSQQNNQLSTLDNFNLEYIRTGGSLQAKTSKQFFSIKGNQLPKIMHTTLYSKALPKGRERIKDANEILRDLRKRFQEKLRI